MTQQTVKFKSREDVYFSITFFYLESEEDELADLIYHKKYDQIKNVTIDLGVLDLGNNYMQSHLLNAIAEKFMVDWKDDFMDVLGQLSWECEAELVFETNFGRGTDKWVLDELYDALDVIFKEKFPI